MAPGRPPLAPPFGRRPRVSDGPPSPCIRQCCLDDADECIGCGRTLEEIKAWHGADDRSRAAILQAAEARLTARARRFAGRD